MLDADYFDRDALALARDLIGKVIRHRVGGSWLAARVIEAEAYYRREKGSHASLGRTPSREALFMPPGTIYMYYSRGGDSLNVSARGAGNAVLIKSGLPFTDRRSPEKNVRVMQANNPLPGGRERPRDKLCSGQTLLCRSLGLSVAQWNGRPFDPRRLLIEDVGQRPDRLIQARRLGIPEGRDEHLLYRFVDFDLARYATANPLTRRAWREGIEYRIVATGRSARDGEQQK